MKADTVESFSNGKIVNDPAGAQTFRHMANRYMNINDIPVVPRMLDQPIRFRFGIGTVKHCEMKQGTQSPERSKDGKWILYPGEYVLEL